jgi:hypothetical protein
MLVASINDPWLAFAKASRWASRWGCPMAVLGAAGHVNVESGHGPLPLAEQWVRRAIGRLDALPDISGREPTGKPFDAAFA